MGLGGSGWELGLLEEEVLYPAYGEGKRVGAGEVFYPAYGEVKRVGDRTSR